MIEAVLFDMDGVLVESEQYINKAGVAFFREKGIAVDPADFLPFTGMGEDRYLGGVANLYGIPFDPIPDKKRTYEIYEEMVHGRLDPLPGVVEFIEECRSRGLRIAVATSADLVKMEINLREIKLPASTFDATVNGLEIAHKKPSPDIFLLAAKRLQADPRRCLVVEDAVSGVAAGKSAGSRVLALTTTFNAAELAAADWIAENLACAPVAVFEW